MQRRSALAPSSIAVSDCNADAKTVDVAVTAYRAQTGHYPAGKTEAAAQALLVPNWIRSWPNNPSHYVITLGGTTSDGVFTANGLVIVSANGGKATSYDLGKGAVCSTLK